MYTMRLGSRSNPHGVHLERRDHPLGGAPGVVHSLVTREIYLSGVISRSNPAPVDLAMHEPVDNPQPDIPVEI
jgi:hypothetical protein